MAGSSSDSINRSQLVIVAIPSDDDPVWKYSSEKVPHMTLLYLGEDLDVSDVDVAHVTEHVEYAASLLSRFGMDVDRRGVLGDQEADVLFFAKSYGWKRVVQFRHNLMMDNVISKLWHSATQFPEWTPHLTMGFPQTPAKKDDRDYPGFHWVNFDRIALWTGESTGPTFVLKENHAMEAEMTQGLGANAVADIIEHYGVKGMKWGKHKAAKIEGARSSDSKETVGIQKKAKETRVSSLSNKELQTAINRMNLEQQFVRLTPQSKSQKARKFVADLLVGVGKQQATQTVNTVASQQISAALNKKK